MLSAPGKAKMRTAIAGPSFGGGGETTASKLGPPCPPMTSYPRTVADGGREVSHNTGDSQTPKAGAGRSFFSARPRPVFSIRRSQAIAAPSSSNRSIVLKQLRFVSKTLTPRGGAASAAQAACSRSPAEMPGRSRRTIRQIICKSSRARRVQNRDKIALSKAFLRRRLQGNRLKFRVTRGRKSESVAVL
jgi:hypothetical protein